MLIISTTAFVMGVIFAAVGLSTGIYMTAFGVSAACLIYALVTRKNDPLPGYREDPVPGPDWAEKLRVDTLRRVTDQNGYHRYYDEDGTDITEVVMAGLVTWNEMEDCSGACDDEFPSLLAPRN